MTALIRCVLLFCVAWLGGCTYVGTTTPITDSSVSADKRLIGFWVPLGGVGLFNVIEDTEANKLYVVAPGLGSGMGSCLIIETRTLQFIGYGLLEIPIQDGVYECISPHKNFFSSDLEKLEKAGLVYGIAPYKLAKLNDPEMAEFKEENAESIQKLIDYYEVTDQNLDVFVLGYIFHGELSKEIQAGRIKGVIDSSSSAIVITDTPEAIRTYFSTLKADSPLFRWGEDYLVRVKSSESTVKQ